MYIHIFQSDLFKKFDVLSFSSDQSEDEGATLKIKNPSCSHINWIKCGELKLVGL